jgi:hypothetical protein
MAMCLVAMFGQVSQVRRQKDVGIKLYMRVGGKYVGNLKPGKSLSAFDQVRNLQRQAFLLCGHPTRTLEDILLYVHNVQVGPPGLAYLDDLDEEASLQVQSLLHGCTSLEMMYDESDEYAKQQVSKARISVSVCSEVVIIALTGFGFGFKGLNLPKELGYVAKLRKKHWWIYYLGSQNIRVDFSVFGMKYGRSKSGSMYPLDIDNLDLYHVTPTNYMHCNVKRLKVTSNGINCKVYAELDQLEYLRLTDVQCLNDIYNQADNQAGNQAGNHAQVTYVERNFKALAGLPNLQIVCLISDLVTRRSASELLEAMALMPHVTWLDRRDSTGIGNLRVTLQNMQLGHAAPKRVCALTCIARALLAVGCVVAGFAAVVIALGELGII